MLQLQQYQGSRIDHQFPLLFLISPGDDIIEGSFVFYAWFSGHERKIAGSTNIVNMSISKSDNHMRAPQTSPSVPGELRYPHDPDAARACGCADHDDLYPLRAEQDPERN